MAISDDNIKTKAKYGVGDRLFYIQDGYVAHDYVTAVYKDKWGQVYYTFSTRGERDQLNLGAWYDEYMCFQSKASLLKSL